MRPELSRCGAGKNLTSLGCARWGIDGWNFISRTSHSNPVGNSERYTWKEGVVIGLWNSAPIWGASFPRCQWLGVGVYAVRRSPPGNYPRSRRGYPNLYTGYRVLVKGCIVKVALSVSFAGRRHRQTRLGSLGQDVSSVRFREMPEIQMRLG